MNTHQNKQPQTQIHLITTFVPSGILHLIRILGQHPRYWEKHQSYLVFGCMNTHELSFADARKNTSAIRFNPLQQRRKAKMNQFV